MSLYRRIANLFSRSQVDRDIAEELRAHIEMRTEENRAAGMTPEAARRDALVRFGNPAALKEKTAAADSALFLESVWADMRFALRQLRSSPGFAIAAVLALSLGIGAATAIFSVVDAMVLRPLPFANPDRLVYPFMKSQTGTSRPDSYLGYLDERAQLSTFDALAGFSTFDRINMESPSGPVSLRAVKTTDNFFNVFGVMPLLGRTFLPGEDQPGKDNVAVLSYEVWQDHFGGSKDVVGKTVQLDGATYTILGVMPSGFRFPLFERDALYTPLHAPDSWKKARGLHWLKTVGRIKQGVSLQQAQADISRVMANLAKAYPEQETGHTAELHPLAGEVNGLGPDGKMRGPLRMLALAVLALLGIACVNVAGLLLARGVKREREIALRAAVGAHRMRLVRQMVSESLVLSAAGLAGGLLTSLVLLKAMNIYLVEAIARGADVHLNLAVVAASVAISVLTSVLASLAPAMRLSGTSPNCALRSGMGAGIGKSQHRLRSGFVVTQFALSLVLLMVAGLLIQNLQRLLKTDLGTDPTRLYTVHIALSPGRYVGRDPLLTFYRPLLDRVAQLPGVTAAGVIDILPIAGWGDGYEIHITGQPPYPKGHEMGAETRVVSQGYFDAIGMKLMRGRLLSPALDKPANAAGSMVVNEAFRKMFFPDGTDPIGAQIDDADKAENKSGIVGVVSNVRQDVQLPAMPEMDWLIDAIPPDSRLDQLKNMYLVINSANAPGALDPSLRAIIHDLDPGVPYREAETMSQVVQDQLVFERMEGWLYGIFAAFAVLLAIIGLYGLVNHEVELRTREIGIRMALGSTRALIVTQILRRVALLMAAGVVAGWALALALRKILAAVVATHGSHDLALFTGITAGLVVVGVLASLLPARAAALTQPVQALRSE
jgi:putative ABC transport system permease protein